MRDILGFVAEIIPLRMLNGAIKTWKATGWAIESP